MSEPVVLKIAMLGDAGVGKTSLMVKYVSGKFQEEYIATLGVNFLEKVIEINEKQITFMIWDLAGRKEFADMLPIACCDAVCIFFMFDLTNKLTLSSIKDWYIQARNYNKTAIPFLVGTKYDKFAEFEQSEQEAITTQARKVAKAMKSPLVFCSASASINIQKLFKIALCKVFDLPDAVPKIEDIGSPIIEY